MKKSLQLDLLATLLFVSYPNTAYTVAFAPSTCCAQSSSWTRQSKRMAAFTSATVDDDDLTLEEKIIVTRHRLVELQQRAAPVVADYACADPFEPVSWLRNCHVQTIGGFLLRDTATAGTAVTAAYVPRNDPVGVVRRIWDALVQSSSPNDDNGDESFWDSRERIETLDGDWFHADTKLAKKNSIVGTADTSTVPPPPTVILLHGLESNSDSPAAKEMAVAFHQQGMNCVCLNFRGCSSGSRTTPNDVLGGYHLGFTDDLKHYLQLLKERKQQGTISSSSHSIYLSGFSLGANVVLKCLGELGETAVTELGIAGAAVVCAPLDQVRNAVQLAKPGINKEIYTSNLLRSLKRRAVDQLERFCNGDTETSAFDFPRAVAAETITEFDDAFIAPIYGFEDCWDYYRQTSSISYLEKIAVPTLVLNAKDDPFFDPTVWPVEKSVEHGGIAPVKLIRTDHGGHLGFVFHQVEEDDMRLQTAQPSWSAIELGRFIAHVQSHESRPALSE